ncbi:MAG: hypothetical protein KBS41_04095, partial [Oscillospiraceae bacterium]|nr:hypothetical protein [Candidatus Equicaccousia limihippi]
MKIALLKEEYKSPAGTAYLLFIAPFLPFPLTFLAVIFSAIYFLSKKQCRSLIFRHKTTYLLAAFFAYTLVIAIINKNLLGIGGSLGFFTVAISALCLSGIFTKELFEKCLNMAVLCAGGVSVIAIAEYIIINLIMGKSSHRSTVWFANCNYLASVLVFAVIICAYKAITEKGNKIIYYICAALSM